MTANSRGHFHWQWTEINNYSTQFQATSYKLHSLVKQKWQGLKISKTQTLPNLILPISSVYYMYLIHTDRLECETILDWLDLSVISSLLYKGTKDVIQHVLSSICFAKRTPSCHAAFAKHTPCRTYPMPNIPAANLGEVHHAPGATWLKLPVAPRLSTFRLTAPTSCQPASAAAYTANISLI